MWLLVVVGLLLGVGLFKVYYKWSINICNSRADLTGKTALVTGANQGIGYWTALDLATRNARVILACRKQKLGEATVCCIREETGNNNIVLKMVDLSEFNSVRKVAAEIIKEEKQLHILINNAGIPSKFSKHLTKTGHEITMATNHFGPFLLTNLLLDLLKQSAPSRIVTVSSSAHFMGRLDVNDLNSDRFNSGPMIYGNTKLANILFSRDLSRRLSGTGVTSNSLEPGCVATHFYDHQPQPLKVILKVIAALFFRSAEEGSRTVIYCAVSEEIEGVTGRYFSNCHLATESNKAKDDQLATKLWDATVKIVGLAK